MVLPHTDGPPGLPRADRALVMGVVNVTPDSFSDGGHWFDPAAAIRHGLALHAEGADLVDVGGESTRPGAVRPDLDEELRRVVGVVRELAEAGVQVSVDTMRTPVAEAALDAGAVLINDVSGGLADTELPRLAADRGVPYVCTHWRGHADVMQQHAEYGDVTGEVITELTDRLSDLADAGLGADQVVFDPGLGFAKRPAHNWTLLAELDRLAVLRRPLLVGASRKSFLGALLADADGDPRPLDARDDAGTAVAALAAAAGVWAVRTHVVRPVADAVRVAAAVRAAAAFTADAGAAT